MVQWKRSAFTALMSVPVRLGSRAVFIHSLTEGLSALDYEPEGKGATEIRQLYKWVCRQVGL